MDARVIFCAITLGVLIVWFWVDVLIDRIETRRGIPGPNIAAACFVFLLAVSSNDMSLFPFQVAALIISVCFAYQTIYYFRIRKNHHPYLSRHAHKN